jgi:predicted ATP-grasp superfamily ATP-dependent carboligase
VKPTVLIATTRRWFSTARLAMALEEAGYLVKSVCPADHPIRKTKAVNDSYDYRGLSPIRSFAEAICLAEPDLIVPGDDIAVQHLHDLHRRELSKGDSGAPTCLLIERSMGAAESFDVVYSRTAFIKLAEEEGIRVPKTRVIANLEELRNWETQLGFPTVLKANGTSGGEGVRVVRNSQEAERAFLRLQAPPIFLRVAKRAILDGDRTLVWPMLSRRQNVVNAQEFIPGREATSLVACWKGTVLAGLHCEVLGKQDSTGPASVVRMIEDPDMASAAEKMVRRLNLSGLHGFDFMQEAATGRAYLIEINPRTTQIGHLRLGSGHDLPAALLSAMSGTVVGQTVKVTDKDTIAFFPQEWQRNPKSAFLESAYHDVPWQEPGLLRACVRKQRKWRTWFSQRKGSQTFSEVRLPRS